MALWITQILLKFWEIIVSLWFSNNDWVQFLTQISSALHSGANIKIMNIGMYILIFFSILSSVHIPYRIGKIKDILRTIFITYTRTFVKSDNSSIIVQILTFLFWGKKLSYKIYTDMVFLWCVFWDGFLSYYYQENLKKDTKYIWYHPCVYV